MTKYIIGGTLFILILLSIVVLGPKKEKAPAGMHKVLVTEVMQAGNYTYLQVRENRQKVWLAVPSMIASAGDTYYYTGGMVMEDFESKELGRVFESVLFLEQVYPAPPVSNAGAAPSAADHAGAVTDPKMNFHVDVLEDGISIADLYSDKKNYDGKTVRIRGAVTRFNPDIMHKNWIHLQDGSEFEGKYDLTITTNDFVEAGLTIIVEGKISLDKDFGYGYFYEVLMEEAKVSVEISH